MSRWPWLACELREILFDAGCRMLDGSYWATSIHDDRSFPEPRPCNADYGGGD